MEEQFIIGRIIASYPDLSHFSEEEQRTFEDWLQIPANKEHFEKLLDPQYRTEKLVRIHEIHQENERFWNNLDLAKRDISVSRGGSSAGWKNWPRYAVAASLMLMLFAAAAIWRKANKSESVANNELQVSNPEVLPGNFKAKLTLEDGSEILLDSAKQGELAVQGNTKVINKGGQLTYLTGKNKNEVVYNTLTTTKGQTYATVLSDGTKVYLNSVSSMRFPVAFNDNIRRVEITGEAYFEVEPSKNIKGKQPFIVSVNGMEVEVRGTHFNINAYADEASMKTTLIEGSVKVRVAEKSEILQPGEQAELNRTSLQLLKNKGADIDQAVAWRFGYFNFARSDLRNVMRQLARWYNLEVEYRGNVSKDLYSGEIPRRAKLSTVLKALQISDVQFKVQGNKIIVE